MSAAPAKQEAGHVAQRGDELSRSALAARPETSPELLFFLANDPKPAVRVAVAANSAAPPLADRLLARDEDTRVRQVLARKIAALASGLDPDAQDRLRRQAWETLCTLVEDEAACVRTAIAEVLAEIPDAPRALILRLANDAALDVAEPVLRLSPMLGEEDLLALVSSPATPATLAAIARRPSLTPRLSDAIAATADTAAIGALLGNDLAAIREATLDALTVQAAEHSEWHAALVRRPRLPAAAQHALAGFVADELLNVLAGRPDVAPGVTAELRRRLTGRLSKAEPEAELGDETVFLRAASRAEMDTCIAILCRRTGLERGPVTRAFDLRSAKALVSLCWKAGLSPEAARAAQIQVAGLTSGQLLQSTGGWPLGQDEMRWQIDLLRKG